jgi:hypothetical protein
MAKSLLPPFGVADQRRAVDENATGAFRSSVASAPSVAYNRRRQKEKVIMLTIANHVLTRRVAAAGGMLLLALTLIGLPGRAHALAEAYPTASPLPVPPGLARIWIFRDFAPYDSLATPYVRLNGAIIGISKSGAVFYRDVAPGTYTVTVDSQGTDVNQFATVDLAPGQQVFVKVLASSQWDSGGGGGDRGGGGWARATFYTWQIQPQAAWAEITRLPLYNGS